MSCLWRSSLVARHRTSSSGKFIRFIIPSTRTKSFGRVQQLLRMAFGHAQLLLYRPFLHYVASTYKDDTTDQRAFACASACVSVSRNIIHITSEMRRRGLLAGAYWFSMYTTFFAIVSILYFVLENPNSPTSLELLRDAAEGKEVLAYFAKRSMAADRCSSALNVSGPGSK